MIIQEPILHKDSWETINQLVLDNSIDLWKKMCKGFQHGYTMNQLTQMKRTIESQCQSIDLLQEAILDMELAIRSKEIDQLEMELIMREQMTPREEVIWIEQQQLISDQEAAYYERREAQD